MSGQEEEDSDKQYEPSQKKLDDARKKGEIARSADLTTAAAYAGLLLAMLTIGPVALLDLSTSLSILLEQSNDLSSLAFAGGGTALHGGILREVAWGVAPWFAVPAVLAIVSVILQRGFLFTGSKLVPKLNRISPISGVKNKFGRQGLFEFAKSSTKLTIYCVVLGFFLVGQIERIIGSMQLPPRLIIAELGHMLLALMGIVLLISLALGTIDFLWQRAEHTRKNRMSRKEMMDELKQSEGDPFIKQQRRQRGHDIATNKMLLDVPTADVVIVNPTHYAIALKWDRSQAMAPICVAKGVDEVAARIREIAAESAVPMHSDPPTARALHAEVTLGQEISQHHYRAVAAAIRFAEGIRKKAARR
ncbi:EscU/YscU/HrcU family type III secretion system export apparatus switch protein [Roseobacter sp. CCS2]|uniref:EscU/YscU/HrcU family type III secretion system export apparatus switch protein n=1 Tax=Roseobacter sp. CCS2 TaxID=391593 RepID=UPI0000F401D4|nr:flagellar type III secretion system protein FlhB [Roseobacter sp. CCS2]EBA13842.1 flagellar biosynthetic protein FlhB [Roseobacter sp. CCS2]